MVGKTQRGLDTLLEDIDISASTSRETLNPGVAGAGRRADTHTIRKTPRRPKKVAPYFKQQVLEMKALFVILQDWKEITVLTLYTK